MAIPKSQIYSVKKSIITLRKSLVSKNGLRKIGVDLQIMMNEIISQTYDYQTVYSFKEIVSLLWFR